MAIYYLRIDTEKENIGIRRGMCLDELNEMAFNEMYYTVRSRLTELGHLEWPELAEKLEQLSNCVDKIQSKARFGGGNV